MNEIAQDLPGLDLGKLYKATERLPDVSKDKQYTAERLKAERPDVYEIARRLFFECGMTKRGICEICRINFRTLGAIIEREILSHGAEFLYKKTRLKKSLITYQLTERIEELATDDAACRTAGINGLVAALKTLHELKEPVIDAESSSNNSITSTAKSDYEQIYESIESNGLGTEKKSAACEDDSTASNENGEQIELASPTDADAIIAQKHSVSQSDDMQILLGDLGGVDNSAENGGENGGQKADGRDGENGIGESAVDAAENATGFDTPKRPPEKDPQWGRGGCGAGAATHLIL